MSDASSDPCASLGRYQLSAVLDTRRPSDTDIVGETIFAQMLHMICSLTGDVRERLAETESCSTRPTNVATERTAGVISDLDAE